VNDARLRCLTIVLLAVLGGYSVARLELTNSITHFIPSGAESEIVSLSLELVESPLSRRMVLAIEGGPSSASVAEELAVVLAEHPEVSWVERGLDEAAMRGIYELYFERRFYLASEHPEDEIPEWTSEAALEARAVRLRQRLAAPDGMLVARTAGADPLGLSERLLERIRASRPSVSGNPGDAKDFATIQIGLASSPFDSRKQTPLLEDIQEAFDRIAARHGGGLRLDQNGVNRFSVAAERSVRSDVNLISSVSMLVVIGLFLLVFRSLRQLGIAFLVPLGGFVFAMAVAVSGGEAVHGITLGFGFALIGVAIDYPIHLMNHYALAEGQGARVILDEIRPSLILSGATTSLAFCSLAWSDFPGLAEMGKFGAIGVIVALVLTLVSLPAFLSRSTQATATQLALSRGSARVVDRLRDHRSIAIGIVLGFAALAAVGLPRLVWEDDPASLMAADPELVAEADRVRARVADFDGARFVVGLAADSESLLELNSAIAGRLEGVIAAGDLAGIGSLHTFLWPESLQRANWDGFASELDLGQRVERVFAKHGFREGSFVPFAEALAAPRATPLRIADLAASPLARVLDSMVELDGRYAAVTFLRGVGSGEAIKAALEGLRDVHYVDQKAIAAELYEGYRQSTTRRVAMGAAIALMVLWLRYRSLVTALLAFMPAALGATCTLGVFGLFGIPVNVASAVSLLVILGMGVDYGIFAVDSAQRADRIGPTLSSLVVSCVTSIFVFGVLALSAQPVLRSIGLTTGLGVLFALALSPLALLLAPSAARR
jgi:predicted exporter